MVEPQHIEGYIERKQTVQNRPKASTFFFKAIKRFWTFFEKYLIYKES